MVLSLKASGVDVDGVADVVALGRDAHPLATRLLREAGLRTGAVLATLVGFLNPERLVIAGSLSAAEAFVAAIRSSVYDLCLPLSTSGLDISTASGGRSVGAVGAAALILDDLLAPDQIDQRVREEALSS